MLTFSIHSLTASIAKLDTASTNNVVEDTGSIPVTGFSVESDSMATASPSLNVPTRVTLPSDINTVREIVLPAGTRVVKISSPNAFYLDSVATTDTGGTTPTSQFMYVAGTYSELAFTIASSTGSSNKRKGLSEATSLFIAPSTAGQYLYIHCLTPS